MKLSILIPTLPQRPLKKLLEAIREQLTNEVEVIYLGDFKTLSVGFKRNMLKRMAKGEYITFVDDDDKISADYVSELLKAIDSGADVICFNVQINQKFPNGKQESLPVDYSIKNQHGWSQYLKGYTRKPNHLMCIKRTIANMVDFEEVNHGEDTIYAEQLAQHLKTEFKIDKTLYIYEADWEKSETLPEETKKRMRELYG